MLGTGTAETATHAASNVSSTLIFILFSRLFWYREEV